MPITIGFHDVVRNTSGPKITEPGHMTVYTLEEKHFVQCMAEIRSQLQSRSVQLVSDANAIAHDSVFLTVDDGRVSTYTTIAPALEELGWRGHFFVTTDWIGRPGFMDARQVLELHARGHLIGSHSCSHPRGMWTLGADELFHEWSESRAILTDLLGHEVNVGAVPAGYYSKRVAEAAAASGYQVLFTSEPTASTSLVNGCRVLGRYTVRQYTSASTVGTIASGTPWCRWKQTATWAATKTAKRTAGKWYLPLRRVLLDALATRAQQHAK